MYYYLTKTNNKSQEVIMYFKICAFHRVMKTSVQQIIANVSEEHAAEDGHNTFFQEDGSDYQIAYNPIILIINYVPYIQ